MSALIASVRATLLSSATGPQVSPSAVSAAIASPQSSASNSYPSLQSLLAANPPQEQVVTLPASQPLSASPSGQAYAAVGQAYNGAPGDAQELVVQHPNPRRILVRVVKPIIFEERIVIVPYRRVTHEVRPVIEERHTVIYGKDGKQISGPTGFGKELPGLDKPGSYASASGHLTRTIEKPVYAEPVVRKIGFSKRSNWDMSNLRPSTSAVLPSTMTAPQSLNRYAKSA
ncbi:hypothetical protein QR98_0077450 [Sarcoptes scabiei]|uniref:Uncharacterized protein n=1 Tax=Sarcoptes scabiei TaxID=52283 RepID=A0A132AE04_SARSC|nr:hypothetical protein QR98_0077450 [Sarcoptes scabiei]